MPYIHWEERTLQLARQELLDQVAKTKVPPQGQNWNDLPDSSKLLVAYNWETSPIHDRRTLDQAFYYTLPTEDIRERDKDQVLSKYMEDENSFQKEGEKEDPRILMVDQLWMWILDTPTKGMNGTKLDTSMILKSFIIFHLSSPQPCQ